MRTSKNSSNILWSLVGHTGTSSWRTVGLNNPWYASFFFYLIQFVKLLISFSLLRVSDAVSDFLSVLRVPRMLQAALHHRRERQTHQRHGVSRLQRAGHQRPRTTGQLLLHAGHTGTRREATWQNRQVNNKSSDWLLHCKFHCPS